MKTKWRIQKTRFVPKPSYPGTGRFVYQCRRTHGNTVIWDKLVNANSNDEARALAIDRYIKETL